MNAGELIIAVRDQLNGSVGNDADRFWTEPELYRYANAARDRLFLYVRDLLIDSTTAADSDGLPLCRITLVVGTGTYALSQKILSITKLKLALQTQQLPIITAAELDANHGDWTSLPNGSPWSYCTDLASDSITFIPAPSAIDTVSMTVRRMPLARLTQDDPDAALGFREEYHEDLINYMLNLAFRKQDSEVYNPGLAEEYLKTFLARADTIKLEVYRRTHMTRPSGTR